MSEQPRLDFDTADPLDLRPRRPTPSTSRAEARDAEARTLAVDPTAQRRARSLGRHRQDARAGRSLRRTAARRRQAAQHPRDHVHAQGRRRDAAADPGRAGAPPPRQDAHARALARDSRQPSPTSRSRRSTRSASTLLREFPLEADVDPGFDLADETETPRLVERSARARRCAIGRGLATESAGDGAALRRARRVPPARGAGAAHRSPARRGRGAESVPPRRRATATSTNAVARLLARLRAAFASVPGGLDGLSGQRTAAAGLRSPRRRSATAARRPAAWPPWTVQALLERVRDHLLTQSGEPRKRLTYRKDEFRSPRALRAACWRPSLRSVRIWSTRCTSYRRDINVVLARAVRRLFSIALEQYRADAAQARRARFFRGAGADADAAGADGRVLAQPLQARSRAISTCSSTSSRTPAARSGQLVELLVRSWAEGAGLSGTDRQPTIFIVGDRKQSIYGVPRRRGRGARRGRALHRGASADRAGAHRHHAKLSLGSRAARVRQRSVRGRREGAGSRRRLPLRRRRRVSGDVGRGDRERARWASSAAATDEAQAEAVAEEIARLLVSRVTVRDRETGVRRAVRPGDIGVLFRTRESHRVFEDALARRRVPFYVYKGLGFFDADEIKDVLALAGVSRAIPRPSSAPRPSCDPAFVRLSDEALKRLAPALAAALTSADPPAAASQLDPYDRERLDAGARRRAALAEPGRSAPARRAPRSRAGRVRVRGGDRRTRLPAGA